MDLDKYKAVCLDCGRKGYCVESPTDWGTVHTRWEGFKNWPPSKHQIRMGHDPDEMIPRCACGGSRVVAVG
jgi:hypothetical protein